MLTTITRKTTYPDGHGPITQAEIDACPKPTPEDLARYQYKVDSGREEREKARIDKELTLEGFEK